MESGNAAVMGNLTDPSNKIVYEMHQYLDTDGSGTHAECVNSTIGAERIAEATTWLRTNKKLGIIGEFAGGNSSVCETAVQGMLNALVAGNDVWQGALWWGGGPFWGDYIFSMEPPSGNGFSAYIDTLQGFAPGVSASAKASSGKYAAAAAKGNETTTADSKATGTGKATSTAAKATGTGAAGKATGTGSGGSATSTVKPFTGSAVSALGEGGNLAGFAFLFTILAVFIPL